MSKHMKVVKNEDNEITIKIEKGYNIFYNKYKKYIIILLVLLLFLIGSSIILTINNTNDYVLTNPNVNVVFPGGDGIIIGSEITNDNIPEIGNKPESDEKKDVVIEDPDNVFDELYNIPDEVIFKTKELELDDKVITYYSDYTAKIKYLNNNLVERIFPFNNNYGVDEKGNILDKVKKHSLKVTKIEKNNHGTITYYSDFSVEIEENDMNIWVGKEANVKEYFITENKFTYVKDVKKYDNYSLTTFYDGTIIIEDSNDKHIVRDINDVVINEYGYLFNYDNNARVINTKKLDNNFTIEYLSDGGAIIYGNDGITSVRKSNSIVVENNNLIKIKTNNIIEITDSKEKDNKKIIYYNNGIGVIEENNKIIGYVKENNNLKYTDKEIINKEEIVPLVSTSKPSEDVEIFVFEDNKALILNSEKKFEDNNNIIISNGVVAIINSNDKNINLANIKVTNNSQNRIKIRIVLASSKNTTLQNHYLSEIKYRISSIKEIKEINNNVWTDNNSEYILYEDELVSRENKNYDLGIWLDYKELGNDAMNKYFYGTLKVYSFEQVN